MPVLVRESPDHWYRQGYSEWFHIDTKGFIVGSICTAILLTGVSSFATGSMLKNISVAYENIKVAVDGETVELKDSRGERVEPFIHDGTTYLPVRALGEILGKEVDWDGKTKTVHLGKSGVGEAGDEFTYLTEKVNAVTDSGRIYGLGEERKMEMGGKTYNTGIDTGLLGPNYAYFYLEGKYTEITGEIGSMYTGRAENYLKIFLDGELYKRIKIAGDKAPQKVTIPVSGVDEIKFETRRIEDPDSAYSNLRFGLGDFKVR